MTNEYSADLRVFSDSQVTAAWFGGVLEIGAATAIDEANYNDRGIRRTKTSPYIQINSSDPQMLRRLYGEYKGSIKPDEKPRFWIKGGYVAAEIVTSTLPFSSARYEHALAMQNWLNAESLEEKISIARELKGRVWQMEGDPDTYKHLLTNPSFVAGVLDSRGYLHPRRFGNDRRLHIQISSKNLVLLDSIKSKFGGKTKMIAPAGTKVTSLDTNFETRVDTYVWEALGSEAVEMVDFAFQFLQSPPPEGWDYRRSIERQAEVARVTNEMAERVRRELKILMSSEHIKLSTNKKLAQDSNLHPKTIASYLSKVLTPEEQTFRLSKTRSIARSSKPASASN